MNSEPERILVIGAGAVGQVYGRHLQAGGAEVTFLVKPHHLDRLRAPLALYPLNTHTLADEPALFEDFQLITEVPPTPALPFQQVWLCVSSTALRQGWFPEVAQAIGDATVVSLLPGLEDRAFLLEYVPEARLVTGLINLISYQAPLPGETSHAPGMAYWFPPMSPTPLSGPPERRDAAVNRLRAGGQPARAHRNVAALSGFPTAVLMPLLLGLEAAGWRFESLWQGARAQEALAGVREALRIVSVHHGQSIPWWAAILRKSSLRSLVWLAPMVVPLPLETYLKFHFTKVGDQTRLFIETYIRLGRAHGVSTTALEALRDGVTAESEAAS